MRIDNIKKDYGEPDYIGDSVYTAYDGNSFILFTYNGGGFAENLIYLDPKVVDNLLTYIKQKKRGYNERSTD